MIPCSRTPLGVSSMFSVQETSVTAVFAQREVDFDVIDPITRKAVDLVDDHVVDLEAIGLSP
jgi:hypothetical protein